MQDTKFTEEINPLKFNNLISLHLTLIFRMHEMGIPR